MNINDIDLSILKAITSSKKCALEFLAEGLESKTFSPDTWFFANLVIGYIKTFKDVPTLRILTEKLAKSNNEKQIETINTIWSKLDNIVFNEKEFKYDLSKLKEKYAEKQLLSLKDRFSKLESGDNINDSINEVQKTLNNIKSINQNKTFESKNLKEYLPYFVESFNNRKNNPDLESGLMTKYSFIDFATNGLKPADFMIVAGESGFGKSIFLNNLAIQVWMQNNTIEDTTFTKGYDIIFFSLEMPYEDCFNRLLSRMTGIPSRKIENAELSKEEFLKVKKVLDFINRYPYQFKIIDITHVCANELDVILAEQVNPFSAIFIDYLGIMDTNNKKEEQDWLKQGIISEEVRFLGRKYKVPTFSAVQLNRKSAKDGAEIGLHRIARSGTIATHATHILQIESNSPLDSSLNYFIIKNRKGPKGKGSLLRNFACSLLTDVDSGDTHFPNYDYQDQSDISDQLEDLELEI